MTPQESKRLRYGDRIQIWVGRDYHSLGTVQQITKFAVETMWDDGELGWIHHNGMADVSTVPEGAVEDRPGQ